MNGFGGLSTGHEIQAGISGAGSRGIGNAAGEVGRRRDDGRLRCDAGSGEGVYFQLRRLESGLTRHLVDKGIEWIARVLIGIVHHNVDKCRHHKRQDLSAVPNLRPVDAAVLGRAAAYELIAQNIEPIKTKLRTRAPSPAQNGCSKDLAAALKRSSQSSNPSCRCDVARAD